MRLFKNLKLLVISSCFLFSLPSCSAFGDDGFVITSSSFSTDQDGNTILLLNTSDEENPTITVTIPKGNDGKDGVSISKVESTVDSEYKDEDGNFGALVKITIYYSDNSTYELEVPIYYGKDGRGIKNVTYSSGENEKENNVTTVTFTYTDDTTSTIEIPNGTNGVGIDSFTSEEYYDSETGESGYKVRVVLTNGEEKEFTCKNGDKGTGILNVEIDSSGDTYKFTITFTDGTMTDIEVDKPVTTKWYYGSEVPSDSDGNDGDFYLKSDDGYVYRKENGKWVKLFSMKPQDSQKQKFYIYLDPNGGYFEGGINKWPVTVTEDTTIDIDLLKTPLRDNETIGESTYSYTFKGFYSTQEENYLAGKLDSLTRLSYDEWHDKTFYAWWDATLVE